jgi:hypothetical protein
VVPIVYGLRALGVATIERPTLFPSEASKREAVHRLVRILGRVAVLFCVVDDHVHAVIVGARRATGRRCADLSQFLNKWQPHRLKPAHITKVGSNQNAGCLAEEMFAVGCSLNTRTQLGDLPPPGRRLLSQNTDTTRGPTTPPLNPGLTARPSVASTLLLPVCLVERQQ